MHKQSKYPDPYSADTLQSLVAMFPKLGPMAIATLWALVLRRNNHMKFGAYRSIPEDFWGRLELCEHHSTLGRELVWIEQWFNALRSVKYWQTIALGTGDPSPGQLATHKLKELQELTTEDAVVAHAIAYVAAAKEEKGRHEAQARDYKEAEALTHFPRPDASVTDGAEGVGRIDDIAGAQSLLAVHDSKTVWSRIRGMLSNINRFQRHFAAKTDQVDIHAVVCGECSASREFWIPRVRPGWKPVLTPAKMAAQIEHRPVCPLHTLENVPNSSMQVRRHSVVFLQAIYKNDPDHNQYVPNAADDDDNDDDGNE